MVSLYTSNKPPRTSYLVLALVECLYQEIVNPSRVRLILLSHNSSMVPYSGPYLVCMAWLIYVFFSFLLDYEFLED